MAEKRAKGPSARSKPTALRNLGAHPDGEGNIEVFTGKYGAYVKHNGTNATLQGEQTPDNITLEQAVALIAEREAKDGGKKKKPAKKAAAKKAPAKKAAKKSPVKKAAKKAVKNPIVEAA